MPEAQVRTIVRRRLFAALAEREMHAWQLATKLKLHPATFSQILHGRRKTPPDLVARVEKLLGVEEGLLSQP